MKKLLIIILLLTSIQQTYSQCWKSVSGGGYFSAAIKTDGTLWQWGSGYYVIAGKDSGALSELPFHIGAATNWSKVSCGDYHALALKTDGTLWSWGDNFAGQLGNGTTDDKYTPTQIGTDNSWQSFSCGYDQTLAIKTNGTLWGWGGNIYGQVGDGTFADQLNPIQIGTDNDWRMVTCGDDHSMAIKNNGTLWSWGYKPIVGDGSPLDGGGGQNTPVQIGTDNDWNYIDDTHAIKTNGTLWGWGLNDDGQLGNGSDTNTNTPAQIGTAINWKTISTGDRHIIATRANGTLWAWGWNFSGQLGDPSSGLQTSPIQIGTDINWQLVSAGSFHSLAIKTDNSLWAWGENRSGQLGDGSSGSFTNKDIPEQISCTAISTLPVTLVSFILQKQQNAVLLTWKTASEFNTKSFEIEYSTNGKDFIKVGNVVAQNSPTGSNYNFKHNALKDGYNYYRLKLVDIDGSYTYSGIIKVLSGTSSIYIHTYPNPIKNVLTIETGVLNKYLSIKIFDLTGKMILKYFRVNTESLEIPVSFLTTGVYVLKVSDDFQTVTKKLIKQ